MKKLIYSKEPLENNINFIQQTENLEDGEASVHSHNLNQLRSGISHFIFKKVSDGSIREAFGTLKLDIMPASYTTNPDYYEKGVARSSATSQSYFDLIAQDWRAYSIENLLTVL